MQCEVNQDREQRNLLEEQLSQALESRDRMQAELNRTILDGDLIQAKLDAILSSRGWRLLERFGVIKHRIISASGPKAAEAMTL
jgi:hypothetical protein